MKAVTNLFANLVRRIPWLVVATVVLLTLVFGYLSSDIEIAQGNEGFAPDNAEIAASERITDLFGGEAQEGVLQVIVRRTDGGDVITAEGLDLADRITQAITEAAPDALSQQPDRPPVVSYMAPVQQAAQQGAPVGDDAAVDAVYQQALQSPEFQAQGGFVTALLAEGADPDQASAPGGLVLAFVKAPEGDTNQEVFDAAIETDSTIADAVSGIDVPEGYEVRPFSFNLLFAEGDDFTGEVGRLFGYAALIILVILGFVYWLRPRGTSALVTGRRTLADVMVTLFTIFAAIGWMQGIGVLLERAGIIGSFNPVTQIVPILLIGLGVDYGIHLTSRYREEIGNGDTVDGGVTKAINTVGVALALATVTTVIGFLTNVFNPVPALKDFGILSAVGILSAFLLMLTFVPAVRTLLDRRAEKQERLPVAAMEAGDERLLPKLIARTAVLAEHVPMITIAVAVVLTGLGIWGLANLETRFSFTDFLPEDAPAVETLDVLTEEFGGGLGESTQILVEGDDLATGTFHNALVDTSDRLAEVDDVVTFETPAGPVPSASSPISLLQQQFAQGPQSAPPDLLAAAQQVGLGDDLRVADDVDVRPLWDAVAAAAPEQWSQIVHTSGGAVDAVLIDIQTQAGEAGADELREGLIDASAPLEEAGADTIPTSQNIISAVIVDALASSQTQSLLLTLVIATIVLAISFWFENRRPFLGVLTMLPVAMVVFWTYGLMYATGIPFGPVTATLAALAVGIGVPFTIHIARRFEEDRKRYEDLDDAIRSTTRHTGGALAGSAFTTMAGFGILITSTLTPFQQMGQVTVYAIGLSLIGAVLVLPSLLVLWEGWHKRRAGAKASA